MDEKRAIEAALEYRWQDALKLNKHIIKLDPQNVDALNRQARAYMELGRYNLAKKYYCQVLKADPYNPIAQKNLKIIKAFKTSKIIPHPNGQVKLSPSLFLQEPGKTKVVNLLNVCEPQKISQAYCGMKVDMILKNRKITVVDENGEHLGVLPDDISHHLTRLLRGGNKYELFIKSIRINALSVLIRETLRSKRFKNQPSFLDSSISTSTTDMLTPLESNEESEPEEEEEEEQVT
ncbi:hypothetical protein HYT18_04115 [Candidatus Microgenomates bacterium]|nr:hypothetical protein [Candidatus Microgenomates bacterium]